MEKSSINSIQLYIANAIDGALAQELENISLCRDSFIFQLNAALRAQMCLENAKPFLQSLDNAFIHCELPSPLVVYRGFNYKEMIRYLHNGCYLDFGYMSTSFNIKTAIDFISEPQIGYFPALIKIDLPKGTNAILIDKIQGISGHYEGEVLIKRRSKFKVKKDIEISLSDIVDELYNSTVNTIRYLEIEFEEYLKFT